MKLLLALLASALLSLCACACGDTKSTSSSPETSSTATSASGSARNDSATNTSDTTLAPVLVKVDGDRDNDIGAPHDDTNNNAVLDTAPTASPADQRAVTALIKRYYTIALAGDGVKACSMIYSTLAESVAEDYGTYYGQASAGPSYLRAGKTCPEVMILLFKHFHNQLAAELSKLKVRQVRLSGHHGFAVMSFGSMPERQIPVVRERRSWKVGALLDSELP